MLEEYRDLKEHAKRARENAYAPYSDFRVGAALLTEAGEVFIGCNIENASYPVTLCAECGALAHAVVNGKRSFRAIALYAGEQAVTPCGQCRQALSTFGEMDVVCSDGRGGYAVHKLSALLPHGFADFRREDLKRPGSAADR